MGKSLLYFALGAAVAGAAILFWNRHSPVSMDKRQPEDALPPAQASPEAVYAAQSALNPARESVSPLFRRSRAYPTPSDPSVGY
jgi:hypothetical protein